jgi:hypothetical protein
MRRSRSRKCSRVDGAATSSPEGTTRNPRPVRRPRTDQDYLHEIWKTNCTLVETVQRLETLNHNLVEDVASLVRFILRLHPAILIVLR